jgi:hypothetical protein
MTTDTLPTDDQVAAAKALLARAAAAQADAPKAALIALVTMPELPPVLDALRTARDLNPADNYVGYAITMLEQLRATHTPA